jgi:hypothetical protein
VNGNVVQQKGADDFCDEIRVNFGSTASCIDLRLDLLTDEYGYEIELWLVNDATQEWLGFGGTIGASTTINQNRTASVGPSIL